VKRKGFDAVQARGILLKSDWQCRGAETADRKGPWDPISEGRPGDGKRGDAGDGVALGSFWDWGWASC